MESTGSSEVVLQLLSKLHFLHFWVNLLLTSSCTSKPLVLFSSTADFFFPSCIDPSFPALEITVLSSRNFFPLLTVSSELLL